MADHVMADHVMADHAPSEGSRALSSLVGGCHQPSEGLSNLVLGIRGVAW
jgi:hypothetical protein